jgi:hypothetical protein
MQWCEWDVVCVVLGAGMLGTIYKLLF